MRERDRERQRETERDRGTERDREDRRWAEIDMETNSSPNNSSKYCRVLILNFVNISV